MPREGILIIDDNVTDGFVIKRTLSSLTHEEITIARNGLEALSFFSQRLKGEEGSALPRLITLDLNMPKMNGFEVLERIKKNSQTKDIPIIILTSSQLSEEVKRSYYLGANSYIVKPTDHDEFEKIIGYMYNYWFVFSKIPLE